MSDRRLSVALVAPNLNGDGLGEVYSIFQLVEALCEEADVTVFTISISDQRPLAEQLPKARVFAVQEPDFFRKRFERFNSMAKPALPFFFRWARRKIAAEMASGHHFDIAHQILPQAMRFPCPLRHLGLPYVIGPLGGSLETPPAFQDEVGSAGALFTKLRALDRPRLRHDPWLRSGYAKADLILGVAPYIGDTLRKAGIPVRRFEPVLERGSPGALPTIDRQGNKGQAKLLHVGRVVRTKALRDVVRALAQLKDLPGVTLTSAGDGEDLEACRAEAEALGVADRVTFLGRIPREEVDTLYREADIFAFPSFREPMGGVFFEAMSFGLPVIAAARGGPDFIIDDSCGLRLPVETPDQFATAIAGAIRRLAEDPEKRLAMGRAAQARLNSFGNWSDKARSLVGLYREAIDTHGTRGAQVA